MKDCEPKLKSRVKEGSCASGIKLKGTACLVHVLPAPALNTLLQEGRYSFVSAWLPSILCALPETLVWGACLIPNTVKHQGWSAVIRREGKLWARCSIVVYLGKAKWGRLTRWGQTCLNSFSRLWTLELPLVAWYLALGWLGKLNIAPEYENLIKKVRSKAYSLWVG